MASVSDPTVIGSARRIEPTSQPRGTLQGRKVQPSSCTPITSRLLAIKDVVLCTIGISLAIPCTIISLASRMISCGACCSDQDLDAMTTHVAQGLSNLFRSILRVINPNAWFAYIKDTSAYQLIDPVRDLAEDLAADESFIKRHVFARCVYLAVFLGGLPLRVADIAIGLIATPFALITCGMFSKLNGRAVLGWESIGQIFGDTCYFLGKMVSPSM